MLLPLVVVVFYLLERLFAFLEFLKTICCVRAPQVEYDSIAGLAMVAAGLVCGRGV